MVGRHQGEESGRAGEGGVAAREVPGAEGLQVQLGEVDAAAGLARLEEGGGALVQQLLQLGVATLGVQPVRTSCSEDKSRIATVVLVPHLKYIVLYIWCASYQFPSCMAVFSLALTLCSPAWPLTRAGADEEVEAMTATEVPPLLDHEDQVGVGHLVHVDTLGTLHSAVCRVARSSARKKAQARSQKSQIKPTPKNPRFFRFYCVLINKFFTDLASADKNFLDFLNKTIFFALL